VFTIAIAVVVAFQVALALGAPWGAYAMGGAFPGVYPPFMRVAALVQAALLVLMALIVVSRAGLVLPRLASLSRRVIWVVVIVSAIAVVANLLTPSPGERNIWAPVSVAMLACSVTVAIRRGAGRRDPPARPETDAT
jgi:hypothetical protein